MKKFLFSLALMSLITGEFLQAKESLKATQPESKSEAPTHQDDLYSTQGEWPGACQHGTAADGRQSPIALTRDLFPKGKKDDLKINFKPSDADIIDNGHTLIVKFVGDAGQVELGGKIYDLKQFHFHKSSEHTLNGKRFKMEAHFVSMSRDVSPTALALGFFVDQGFEKTSWKYFWKAVPVHTGAPFESTEAQKEIIVAKVRGLNARKLVPEELEYLAYEGSLTTPPCDEIVTHVVAKKPLKFSAETIKKFGEYHEISNRDLQPLGNPLIRDYRVVKEKESKVGDRD